ncbi:MAG: M20/M25/M40 family metallo-hydrolase [Myxococcota bacterium]
MSPRSTPSARFSARAIPLFAALLVASASTAAPWPFDTLFGEPSLEEQATQLLSEAIQTQTVNPPGREQDLARLFADALDRAGLETEVIETPQADGALETARPRAAVWARLRGQGDRPALILLSHLDTVPAHRPDWSVDPYAGKIWDGFVWGRGALDAKGVGVTHLMTLIELARSEIPLDRDIIFLATPDEETGGRLGAGWLAANRPDLVEGAGYLLTEGGGIQIGSKVETERPPVWGVTLTEKAPCWLELRAKGRAGHSSSPAPDAAVPRLIAALDRIRRAESPIRVLGEVQRMFSALAPLAPNWDRAGFDDLAATLESDDAFRRRFLGNPGQNALVRNTVSITVLEGAPKTNIAPSVARAQLDARLLPGESCSDFSAALAELIDETSIEIEEILSFPAAASTSDTPLYRAIERLAARNARPGLVVPRMIGGFTDAHWFREMGIVAYGFVPRALASEDARRVHGTDERMSIEALVNSIQLSVELVREFDALETAEAVASK